MLFLVVSATPPVPSQRRIVSVPFRSLNTYMLVEASVDGRPVTLLVDTGANKTILNARSMGRVQLPVSQLMNQEQALLGMPCACEWTWKSRTVFCFHNRFGDLGLLQSELFGLKWQDIDFEIGTLRVTRSVVQQMVGNCKTEASQKAIPLQGALTAALEDWRRQTPYKEPHHWVFASPHVGGKMLYWGQPLMRSNIRPIAKKLGITKRIGWHTFRHTYSTLLCSVGADPKVMQELLRHSTLRGDVGNLHPSGYGGKTCGAEHRGLADCRELRREAILAHKREAIGPLARVDAIKRCRSTGREIWGLTRELTFSDPRGNSSTGVSA
jgi:hypothetical protein